MLWNGYEIEIPCKRNFKVQRNVSIFLTLCFQLNSSQVVFNQAQIQMFTYEQAFAVTDRQRSALSPVQETALSMVLNPWENKPIDFRGTFTPLGRKIREYFLMNYNDLKVLNLSRLFIRAVKCSSLSYSCVCVCFQACHWELQRILVIFFISTVSWYCCCFLWDELDLSLYCIELFFSK